jgi:hypothetical protein
MSYTLYLLHYERNEDGHVVEVYQDQRGNIRRITVFPTVDFIRHQTKVLEATEHLLRQRANTELARAELQDVRDLIDARRRDFQQQLAHVTNLPGLPAPRNKGG